MNATTLGVVTVSRVDVVPACFSELGLCKGDCHEQQLASTFNVPVG